MILHHSTFLELVYQDDIVLVAEPYIAMKMRILLALGTGLRRGDIDSLKISDIDFDKNSISTTSRKTKKSMGSRPVSAEVMAELSTYVCSLGIGQKNIISH